LPTYVRLATTAIGPTGLSRTLCPPGRPANRGGRRRSFVRYGNFTTWNPGGKHSGQYLRGLPALRSISNVSPHMRNIVAYTQPLVYDCCSGSPSGGGRDFGVPVSIGFTPKTAGLVCCVSGWRVPGIPVPHSLLDPLHHRPAVRRAGCIAALTTSTLPALWLRCASEASDHV
jgi:hypothetical protein